MYSSTNNDSIKNGANSQYVQKAFYRHQLYKNVNQFIAIEMTVFE